MRILILGGGGFIGFNLLLNLSENANLKISVFTRHVPPHLSAFLKRNRSIKLIFGDFQKIEDLKRAVKNQDIVYHLISSSFPFTSWDAPQEEVFYNLMPSLGLIQSCAEAGVKKIAFSSSGGTVYGLQKGKLNESLPTHPFSPHGIVKVCIENFLEYASVRHNLNYDVYRMSNVYGPYQDTRKGLGVINTWLEKIINKEQITIYGSGENVRDYIYIKDVARLLTLSVSKDVSASDIYNVGTGIGYSLNDIISILKNDLKLEFSPEYIPQRESDNRSAILDNWKILGCFNDYKFQSLSEGIKITHNFIKDHYSE